MGFKINVKFDIDPNMLSRRVSDADHELAMQVESDTEPFTPQLTGSLIERTKVEKNLIIYPEPYARYLYHGKVMVNRATGKGPMHIIDEFGNSLIRFPKGSKLRATERNLDIKQTHSPHAQAEWFEASKALNLEKWKKAYKKAVTSKK